MDCQAGTTSTAPRDGSRPRLPYRVSLRRTWSLLLAVLPILLFSGCQIIIGTLLTLGGRPTVDCDFKTKTSGESLAGKDKRIVVLCRVPDSARAAYGGLNYDLVTEISRTLKTHDIRVADSQKVATWLDDHGTDLTDLQIADVAKRFKSNYVLLINLAEFSFYEKGSPDMYRGKSNGYISVHQIEDVKGVKTARRIYHSVFNSSYPGSQPIPVDQEGEHAFKSKYVKQVAEDIARRFHDYRTEDTM